MQKNNFQFSTLILAGFIILIFILQNAIPNFTDSFKLIGSDIFKRPWILITSIFLHANMPHLLLNLFSLVLFGIILENVIGTKKYLLIFLATGFLSSFISSFFYSSALGASGAIFGILGTLVILRPKMMIWVYGMPMPMAIAGILYLGINFFGAYFNIGNTGYIAHLSGLIAGLFFGIFYRKKYKEQKPSSKIDKAIEKDLDSYEREYNLR